METTGFTELYKGLNPILTDTPPAGGEIVVAQRPTLGQEQYALAVIDYPLALSGKRTMDCLYVGNDSQSRLATRKSVACPVSTEQLYSGLSAVRDALLPSGTVAIFTDIHSLPNVKPAMDQCFGRDNFVNEIVLHYRKGGKSKNSFLQRHESLLLYKKTDAHTINVSACGDPRGISRNHMKRGITPEGRTYAYMFIKNKEYRYYDDDLVPYDDVWDIDPFAAKEDTGLAGQRPAEIYRRLVLCLTQPGDRVAELYMGAGTLSATAAALNRGFTGFDVCPVSAHAVRGRLLALDGCDFTIAYHMPMDRSATVSLEVVNRGTREVLLNGISAPGYPVSADNVAFWAVGSLQNKLFTAQDYALRRDNHLRDSMVSASCNAILVSDCFGNCKLVEL